MYTTHTMEAIRYHGHGKTKRGHKPENNVSFFQRSIIHNPCGQSITNTWILIWKLSSRNHLIACIWIEPKIVSWRHNQPMANVTRYELVTVNCPVLLTVHFLLTWTTSKLISMIMARHKNHTTYLNTEGNHYAGPAAKSW